MGASQSRGAPPLPSGCERQDDSSGEPEERRFVRTNPYLASTRPCSGLVSRRSSACGLFIGNTDHIGVVGDNGCGKTTLVKKIISSISDDVQTLYIPQEPTELQKTETLRKIKGLSNSQRGRVLSIVAQLNSDPDCVLAGESTSPGEMRKLMLAQGMLDSPELVVMDEPTNYLDLGSTVALERLLSEYPGALLLVSHDFSLIDSATSIKWSIQRSNDNFELVVQ